MFEDIITKLDIVILIFLVITSIACLWSKNLLVATVLLGVFSLLMAVQYLILGAPDVAMTEAAVGAGISTILLLLTLFIVGIEEKANKSSNIIPLIVTIISTTILIFIVFEMPAYGDADSPAHSGIADYFITKSGGEIGIPNAVTSILASYRGFDTLGETAVVFTSAMAVILLLGRLGKEKSGSKD